MLIKYQHVVAAVHAWCFENSVFIFHTYWVQVYIIVTSTSNKE